MKHFKDKSQIGFVFRIHGSYEALEGGWTQDALVDFTGGLGMSIDLTEKDKLPEDTFNVMLRQQRNNALLGCSIRVSVLPSPRTWVLSGVHGVSGISK